MAVRFSAAGCPLRLPSLCFLFRGARSPPAAVPIKERSLLSVKNNNIATSYASASWFSSTAPPIKSSSFRNSTPSLAILYGRKAIRFLGSVNTRLLPFSSTRTSTTTSQMTTSSRTSTSSSATCLLQPPFILFRLFEIMLQTLPLATCVELVFAYFLLDYMTSLPPIILAMFYLVYIWIKSCGKLLIFSTESWW